MRKRIYLFAILLSFSLLISVNLTNSQEPTGTCLRKTTNFCQSKTIEECCGTNQECREKLFYPGVSPADTGLCNYPTSCCLDTCTDAQIYGIYSPLACSNQSAFVQKSCNEFSECKLGCAFCSGDTKAIGVYKLKDASAECIRLGKTLSYFNDTVTNLADCLALTQPITETFSVSGNVVISGTTTGIPGATVMIAGKSTTTDANGNFRIENVAKGNHTITAIADFYAINYTILNVVNNIANYRINLTRLNNATLEVTVLNSSNQIVPDAIVEINKSGTPSFYQKLATGSNGKATFRYIPFGTYQIIATKSGFRGTGSIELSEAQLYEKTITLETAVVITYSNLTGVIRNSTGSVIDSANITLTGPTTVSTLSSNGAYEFRNIPSGTYTVTITPPAGLPLLPLTDVITLQPGGNETNFTLLPVTANFTNVTLQVNQTNGTPIPNARIKIKQITAATEVEVVTNESGSYTIQLQKTSYNITVIKEGFNVLTDVIDLSQLTSPTTFTFLLSTAARVSISGTVKDTDGNSIAAAQVYIEGLVATIAPTFAITDGNGYYQITNIPTGNYTLTASKTGYISQSFLINLDSNKEQNFVLTQRECNVQIIKPELKKVELKKDRVEIEFMPSCESTGAYIYRCELIGSECDMKPITNILPREATSYVDENIKPETTYFYEVRTVHERPYVQFVASDRKSVNTGHPSCFFESNEFCLNQTRYKCDANNSLQEIIPTDPTRRKSDDTICRYRIDNPGITEYVRKLNCTIECTKPLGMFAAFGNLAIPLPTPPQTTTMQCDANENNIKDKIPEIDVLSCYRDYTATAVDKFYSCDEVKSCYDYKSEAACKQNRCLHKTPCEWIPYPEAQNLGLGVCRPTNTSLQDCNFCNLDKYNNLFGNCTSQTCDLYAAKTEKSGCYFETISKKCLNKREMSCEYYKNESDCIGTNPVNVSVDIYGNNKIIERSNDYLGLGLCKFDTTYANRCIKDANNDSMPDLNSFDMKPPITIIEHPTAAKAIDFNVFVYDDEDFNTTIKPYSTKFFVGSTFVGPSPGMPYREAQNGRLIDYTVPDGVWNVYFFSEDNANNLEIIKSFRILIDSIKPNVTVSYGITAQGGGKAAVSINLTASDYPDTTKPVRCKTSLVDGLGNLVREGTITEDILFTGTRTETFTGLSDGFYNYKYSCKDWVGNEKSDSVPILVDTDQFITIIAPNGTVTSAPSIEIRTVLDANCMYDVTDNLTKTNASFTNFQTTGGTSHSSSISSITSNENNKTYKLFVKCRITTPTGETRDTNVKETFFTIDNQEPHTNITIPESDLVPFNLTRWRKSASFKLKCNDPDIPSDRPDFAPGEFGCDVLKYCIDDVQCSPVDATRNYNATEFDPITNRTRNVTKTEKLTEKALTLTSTKWLCYQSVDKGGNQENSNCELIRIDTTAPIVKITGTNPALTSDGRTNSPTINIMGTITNNAFFAEQYSGMIPYAFDNYTLNAVVSGDRIAEIRFNYINNNTYDYLIFNFEENKIMGKIGTQSISQSASIRGQQVPLRIERSGTKTTINTNGINNQYSSTSNLSRIVLQTGNWKNITIADDSITSPLSRFVIKLDNTTIVNANITNLNTTFNEAIPISELLTKPGFKGKIEVFVDDEAGNTGSNSIDVTLDVIGPVDAPIIDPPITKFVNSFNENYQKLNYPLYYDGSAYYANTTELWITGYTAEQLERIEFVREASGNQIINSYQEVDVAALSAPNALRTKYTMPKGSNSIAVSGNQNTILDYFRNTFGGNVYIYFIPEIHHRKSFGNYMDFYSATSWSFDGRDTIINIEPALEDDVPEGAIIFLTNGSRASNRFSGMINLDGTNINGIYGNNTFWINQYDDLGNSGRSLDRITIYVDGNAPTLDSSIPAVLRDNDNVTINSIKNITFSITENGFGIRPEEDGGIQLSINGMNKTFEKSITSSGTYSHNLKILYKEQLADGQYNVTLIVKDKAGNELRRDWNIVIDSALPSYPQIEITNNVNISSAPDGYVFVTPSSKPEFRVAYPDYLIDVNLTSASLINKTAGSNSVMANYNVSCDRVLSKINTYICSLNQELPQGNNDYALRLRSQKIYTGGQLGPIATHDYYFAVDNTAPAISNLKLEPMRSENTYINSASLLEYSINVENENHPLYVETKINNVVVSNSTAINPLLGVISVTANTSSIVLIDGTTYPFESLVCDYAGNCNSIRGSVTIDDTSPRFTTNLTIEAKPLFIAEAVYGNATYVVREDLITITGTLEQDDTMKMELYRGNPKTTNPLMTITPCIANERINCISGSSFNFKGTTILMGEVGKAEQNNIYLVATDRAGNKNSPPLQRVILKDVRKPAIQICVEGGLKCTVRETEKIEVITDTATMKQKCGANSDCYNTLLNVACNDLLSKGKVSSFTTCYKDYVVALNNPELWVLCDNAGLLRDDCIFGLAEKTKIPSLCSNIVSDKLQTKCIATSTS